MTIENFKIHIAFIISAGVFATPALAQSEVARKSADLYAPSGSTAAFSEGGTAVVSDLSAIDSNPASLGLTKADPAYLVGGEVQWTQNVTKVTDFGIVDSSSAEVPAAFRVRRTTRASGVNMYRLSLGVAEPLENIPLYFGLAGDFNFFEKPANAAEKKGTWQLRGGLMYQVSTSLFFGVRTSGWFAPSRNDRSHAAGATWITPFGLLVSADAIFDSKTVKTYVGSGSYSPAAWLDLMAGYGYEVDSTKHRTSGSVVLKSEKVRLSYTLVKPANVSEPLRHSVSCSINTLAVEKN